MVRWEYTENCKLLYVLACSNHCAIVNPSVIGAVLMKRTKREALACTHTHKGRVTMSETERKFPPKMLTVNCNASLSLSFLYF